MSDRINCRNCIHFNDLENRCCLNDGKAIKRECYFILSNRKPKGKDVVIENLKTKISDLETKLAESEKRIQAYEEIVEQKDKEISFANRDKTCIVKQLNDPKAYVLLEDYKEIKQQLEESEERFILLEGLRKSEAEKKDIAMKRVSELKQQLAEKEKEIDNLYNRLNSKQKFYEMSLEKDYKEYLSRLDKLEKQCDKDKIECAVEKLTDVRSFVSDVTEIKEPDYTKVCNFIDNQINELKEGK